MKVQEVIGLKKDSAAFLNNSVFAAWTVCVCVIKHCHIAFVLKGNVSTEQLQSVKTNEKMGMFQESDSCTSKYAPGCNQSFYIVYAFKEKSFGVLFNSYVIIHNGC